MVWSSGGGGGCFVRASWFASLLLLNWKSGCGISKPSVAAGGELVW